MFPPVTSSTAIGNLSSRWPIQKEIVKDSSGAYKKHLLTDFETKKNSVKSQMNVGASSEEFEQLKTLHAGIESAVAIIGTL